MLTAKIRVFHDSKATKIHFPENVVLGKEEFSSKLNLNEPAVVLGDFILIDLDSINIEDKFLITADGVEAHISGRRIKDYFEQKGTDNFLIADMFDPRYAKPAFLL